MNTHKNRTTAVIAGLLILLTFSPLAAQEAETEKERLAREDELWNRSDEAILAYMEESSRAIAQGYAVGFKGFTQWFNAEFIPLVNEQPSIDTFMEFYSKAITSLLLTAVPPGKFVEEYVVPAAQKWFEGVVADDHLSSRAFLNDLALDYRLEQLETDLLLLPQEFDKEDPTLFEDAMWEYFNEELETPHIHDVSDHKMGEWTREKLAELGFPEPSRETIEGISEEVMIPLVYKAKLLYQSRALDILEPWEIKIDAQIAARRFLYRDDPERYCEGSGALGWLAPDDCQ